MIGRVLLVAVLAVAAPAQAMAQRPIAEHPKVQQALELLRVWLDAQRAYDRLPGLSAAVVHDQQVIWSGGVGVTDLAMNTPATDQTIYSICSISKLFPFRLLCRSFGADVVVSEFLTSEGLRRGIQNVHDGAYFTAAERPIGIQVYGADPDAMAEAAGLVTQHYAPDFVDINFGCPVKKVVKRNGGSGCLKDLDLVTRIIRAVRGATPLPVSVKVRSGWDEAMRNPVEIALRCPDAGAQVLTLHPRTRTQMYSGAARWEEIAAVVEALEIPVVGNGDVTTAAAALRMREETGCAGVMIARGSFGNPWIFAGARALLAAWSTPRTRSRRRIRFPSA